MTADREALAARQVALLAALAGGSVLEGFDVERLAVQASVLAGRAAPKRSRLPRQPRSRLMTSGLALLGSRQPLAYALTPASRELCGSRRRAGCRARGARWQGLPLFTRWWGVDSHSQRRQVLLTRGMVETVITSVDPETQRLLQQLVLHDGAEVAPSRT